MAEPGEREGAEESTRERERREHMKAIDIHAHIFSSAHGRNCFGEVRSERFGRIVNGGEVKPFMPPLSDTTRFGAENLLELMREAEVERAVLVQNPTIGSVNGEILEAVSRYPGIFAGVIQVDPFLDGCVKELDRWAATGMFRALKLELSSGWGWLASHPEVDFHYGLLEPLLEAAARHGLHVIFDTGPTGGPAYRPGEMAEMAGRHPELTFIVEHLGYMTRDGDEKLHRRMLELGRRENVYLGISAVGQLLEEAYPCPRAMELVRRAREIMGAGKLLWGTDCPTTMCRYTYRQMKEAVELHTPFFSPEELELVLWGNAHRLFFSERGG